MKTRTFILSGAALIALCLPAAFAQQSTTTTTDPQSIAQRKDNQQDRVAQGVKSGQLTAGETARLETSNRGSTAKDVRTARRTADI